MIFAIGYTLAFILSLVFSFFVYKKRFSRIGRLISVLMTLTTFWLLMESLSYYVDIDQVVFLQKLKYISIILIAPVLLVTSYVFLWRTKKVSKPIVVVLFIPSIMSLLSVLTNSFPYPFIDNAYAYLSDGFIWFSYDKLTGFYIHTYYSYFIIFISMLLLLISIVKAPKIYKIQSLYIFMGFFLCMLVNALFISNIIGQIKFDSTPLAMFVTLMFFYWGEFVFPKKAIVPHARNLVIENMKNLVIIVDNIGNIIDINPAAKIMIRKSSTLFTGNTKRKIGLRGMSFEQLMKTIEGIDHETLKSTMCDGYTIEFNFDNEIFYYEVTVRPIYDAHKNTIAQLYMFNNNTEVQNHVKKLLLLNCDLTISDTIINEARESIIITNKDNEIIRVNNSMVVMSGYFESELMGQNPNMLKSDKHEYGFYRDMWEQIIGVGYWEGEIWDRRKSGEIYPKWMTINAIKDELGNTTHYIGIAADITKMKKAEEDIHKMAYYDVLTGLANRTLFYDRLKRALFRGERHKNKVALMFIDLDRFKTINDNYGHSVGDKLLIEVSKRLNKRIRKSDTLSRLGGDEFTIILENISHTSEIITVVKGIFLELEKPYYIDNIEINVSASIGICVSPEDDSTIDGLIRKADIAMYHAKELGGNRFCFSSEEMDQRIREINFLELRLKEAIKNKEFELYLQPQIALIENTYTIIGAEALIRWPQKDGTMIPPDKFIDVAERYGLINTIGLWVLEESFDIITRLEVLPMPLNVAINVSIKQFETNELYTKLQELIQKYGQKCDRLTFEITESLFFNDLDNGVRLLEQIKTLGVQIALDDFGTGFSSLNYLHRLPIDYLKIDKSFVDNVEDHKSLVYMILSMAKILEINSVAEGVEKLSQANRLLKAGCDVLQGYYFGKPMNVEDFITYVKQFDPDNFV